MVRTEPDMLKFVEAMDAFVRLILITVFATGTIQFADFMKSSRSVHALPQYSVEFRRIDNFMPLLEAAVHMHNKTAVTDHVLKMPTVTLTSFNELMQSARPAMQRLRDLAKRRYEQAEVATTHINRIRRKYHEGPVLQLDGSSSRVLLRI